MHRLAGKEVVSLSLQSFTECFQVVLIAPGAAPTAGNLQFYPLRSEWFNKLKPLPLIGHLFNYFYFIYLRIAIHSIVKKSRIQPDVVYMAGPWMSLIGQNLRIKKRPLMVNRYYGTSIPLNYKKTLKNRLRYALKLAGYRKTGDLVIMTNDGTRGNEFLTKLGCPAEKIRFWTNGLHLHVEAIAREKARQIVSSRWGITANTQILLTVSRLAGWKRVDRAIELLASIENQQAQTVLIIAGDGEQRQALEEKVRQLNLGKKVIFAGSLSRTELNWLYPASDVFISLYEHSNAGNPLFEAMLHACCIYTFGGPEVRAYLDENSAMLVEPGTPNAEALCTVLDNRSLRETLGENARIKALQHFESWEIRIERERQEIVNALKKLQLPQE
ncbi:MAG: glycosyltransferase family 4 protein [Bacteroidia bacterium]|nr:glycosyltransferase family 4 protein [Bacteroidia bacterium]MCC6767790.1 glycosyltransferase family 4 protein [Bacteroidia bacterium]